MARSKALVLIEKELAKIKRELESRKRHETGQYAGRVDPFFDFLIREAGLDREYAKGLSRIHRRRKTSWPRELYRLDEAYKLYRQHFYSDARKVLAGGKLSWRLSDRNVWMPVVK